MMAGKAERSGLFAQLCFVVDDLEEAMVLYSQQFGAGPWFLLDEIAADLDRTTYRGIPTPLGARIALGYAGATMFELVEPKPDSRSIFSEWVEAKGCGLHHFGFLTREFDNLEQFWKRDGVAPVMTSVTPLGARVAMIAGAVPFGAFEEYIELIDANERFYAFMKMQADEWDGHELVYSEAKPTPTSSN